MTIFYVLLSSQRSQKKSQCPAKRSPLDYLVKAEVTNTDKVGTVTQLLLEAPPDEATPPTQMKPCKHKCKRIKTYLHFTFLQFTRLTE